MSEWEGSMSESDEPLLHTHNTNGLTAHPDPTSTTAAASHAAMPASATAAAHNNSAVTPVRRRSLSAGGHGQSETHGGEGGDGGGRAGSPVMHVGGTYVAHRGSNSRGHGGGGASTDSTLHTEGDIHIELTPCAVPAASTSDTARAAHDGSGAADVECMSGAPGHANGHPTRSHSNQSHPPYPDPTWSHDDHTQPHTQCHTQSHSQSHIQSESHSSHWVARSPQGMSGNSEQHVSAKGAWHGSGRGARRGHRKGMHGLTEERQGLLDTAIHIEPGVHGATHSDGGVHGVAVTHTDTDTHTSYHTSQQQGPGVAKGGGGGGQQQEQARRARHGPPTIPPTTSPALPSTFKGKLHALLSDREVFLFLCTATLLGFGFGTIETFLFVFLQELGASDTLMGLTLTSE